MSQARILRIYLDPVMLKMAREGTFGFASVVKVAFEGAGYRVDFMRDTNAERIKSATRRGYSLFLMKDPFHPRALSMRKAYYYPFWRIENSAQRWEFSVAKKQFIFSEIDTDLAQAWYKNWRRYLFKQLPETASKTGVVYVPLQGKLFEHRSFQSMSPMDMIARVRSVAGDRRILMGLHPGETYSAAEIAAVDAVAAADSRVTVQTGGMEKALHGCDVVATENSTAALSGFFFGKPAVLFAESDFHHQMPHVARFGVDEAFRLAQETPPDYAEYLYWFIQLNAIKADDEQAPAQILETCRAHGWEV